MNLTNDYLKIMPQINANEHLLFFRAICGQSFYLRPFCANAKLPKSKLFSRESTWSSAKMPLLIDKS